MLKYEQTTVFSANNHEYEFVANTYLIDDISGERVIDIILDNNSIESFEYSNEINQLLLTGELIYNDASGDIGKFFGKNYAFCAIRMQQFADRPDTTTIYTEADPMRFVHTFLIDNISILGKKRNIVKYKLKLISYFWFRLVSRISFTNFDKLPGSEEKFVFKIIKILFNKAFNNLEFVKNDTFDNVKSFAQVDFATNRDSTLLTCLPYLLNKSIFLTDSQETYGTPDEGLSYIVYNEYDSAFQVVQVNDEKTYLPATSHSTFTSLNGLLLEDLFISPDQDFFSITQQPATKMFKTFFNRHMYKFDREQAFLDSEDIQTATIANFSNIKVPPDEYTKKYNTRLLDTWFSKDSNYGYYESMWDNTRSIYSDQILNYLYKDTLVLNTVGNVRHQPGMNFVISYDDGKNSTINMLQDNVKENSRRNIQLLGVFNVIRIRKIIRPNNNTTAGKRFEEFLTLARNFVPKIL